MPPLQEVVKAIVDVVTALTPIALGLIALRQVVDSRKLKELTAQSLIYKSQLKEAKDDLEISNKKATKLSDVVEVMKKTQRENVGNIQLITDENERLNTRLKSTVNENIRISREHEADRGLLKKIKSDHDAFVLTANQNSARDAGIINGLRFELESAHNDTDQARETARSYKEQVDKMEQDMQRLRDDFAKIKKQTDKLGELQNGSDLNVEEKTEKTGDGDE